MRLLPLALAAIPLLIQISVATAQEAPPAAIVATSSQGATLAAADYHDEFGDQLVLTLRGIEPGSDPDSFAETSVEPVPLWPDEAGVVTEQMYRDDNTERVVFGGVVSADVAAIEQRFDDGTVVRLPTVPGDGYAGRYAGRVRFFAGETVISQDDSDDLGQLRTLDASGTVVGLVGDPQRNDHNVRLLRKRVPGRLISIRGTLSDERAPLPLAPEHVRHELCLSVRLGSGELAEDSDTVCQEDKPSLYAVRLGGQRGCGAVPTTLTGFVPAAAERLVVVLGSGRVVRYPVHATPFGRPERVVAAVLPRGQAIRRVSAVDAAGAVLAHGDAGVAPPDRRCATPPSYERGWSFYSEVPPLRFGRPPGTEVAATDPSGAQLLVRDSGEQLCWDIDQLVLDGRFCQDPPANSHGDYLLARPFAGGLHVAGVFAARVAALNLRLAGGGRMTVPLTDGPGYTGRYRGALRFGLFTLPAGAKVADIAFLDAAGQPVGRGEISCAGCPEADPDPAPATLLAAGTGRARVRVGAAVTGAGSRHPEGCIAFAAAGETMDECTIFRLGDASVGALASCSPRRTVVYGMTQHAVRRVEIVLGSGRRVAARVAPFPRRLHTRGRVFLAVLPRDAAVTAVRFPGLKLEDEPNRVPMPLRPARRQCGYTFEADL